MTWSDAARAAALEARRMHATRPGDMPGMLKGIWWRSGPTNDPTGSGIRFGHRGYAKAYGMSPGKEHLQRYTVTLEKPLVAKGLHDAAVRLGLARDIRDAGNKLHAAMQRASKQKGDSKYGWMTFDKKITSAAKRQGYGGLYYTDSVPGSRRREPEVVAFKLSSVTLLPKSRKR